MKRQALISVPVENLIFTDGNSKMEITGVSYDPFRDMVHFRISGTSGPAMTMITPVPPGQELSNLNKSLLSKDSRWALVIKK